MPFEELSEMLSCAPVVHALSSPQLDIYHDQLLKGHVPTYNIGGYLDISGRLDIDGFGRALNFVIKKHDSLRIMLVESEGGIPRQYIVEEISVNSELLDLSQCVAPHDEAREWINKNINIPFNLIGHELFRFRLIKLAEDRFYWFICVHHLIADGWSIDTIFHSLADIYSALERKEAPNLVSPSYIQFLESDKNYIESIQFDKDRSYWIDKYSEIIDPLLSSRHQEQFINQATASGEYKWSLSRDLDEKIDALAVDHQSTRFQVILSILYAFFLRLERRDELTVGLSVLNRKNSESRGISGMFTNVISMRLRFDLKETLVDLIKEISSMLRRDYRHQRFPIGELNKGLELFKSHRSQLYDLSMSYEPGGGMLFFGSSSAVAVKCTNDHESTPLRLCVRDNLHTKDTTMHFIFSRSYFNDNEIEALEGRFSCFMRELLSSPESPIGSLPIITAGEVQNFASWNSTGVAFPDDKCIQELFQLQVEQRLDALAVVHGGASLTYAELNAQANRLAHHLIALGVRPDDRVALCLERSPAMIVSLLAILKAGAAYVPLDPAYPSERLTYALKDAQPLLLLIDASGRIALGARTETPIILDLDAAAPDWAALSTQNPHVPGLTSRHLAYVIYTSGSTGQPKGVMVEHRNVCHQVAALQSAYRLDAQDRLLQFASIAFDMSVEEIFPALLSGAMLVLRTDECLSSPAAFAEFCTTHQLTSLNLPSTFWAQLATTQPEPEFPSTLRQVSTGGDAMSLPAVSAWFCRSGHRPQLFNAYGPTEATVNATLLRVEQALDVASIGRPISNTQVYLLDEGCQPVPLGAVGELYIGGAGVARGYFNRPELTAECFLIDPFSSIPGARMYRTGDLARYLVDGNLEFLGRNDHQVKIRGFRIELGEIEAHLTNHPAVREAVVLALGEGHNKRLVAYLVAETEVADESSLVGVWRAHLAARLPDYMVPAAFVRLDVFPLTPNGKLDRKALPHPGEQAFARRAYEPPCGEVEIALAVLWQELLDVERIGRHDHFFELGGHSLIAMRLLGRVGQEFDSAIPLVSLFNHPTLAGLAAAIDAGRTAGGRTPKLPPILPVVRTQTMPLSYAQQRLWFLAQLDSAGATYHISLVLRLDGELNNRALGRSLDRLLARHEALRTIFFSSDGNPHAALLPVSTPLPLTEYDLRGALDADARLARHTDEYARAPFDLARGPLIRAGLIRLADQRHTLLLSLHHIVADGWSINLLAREISALYAAFSQQRPDPLPPLPVQYPDYASWQRSTLTREQLQGQADYWRQALDGAPELLNLPTDRPRPPRQSFAGAMLPLRVDPSLTESLRHLCKQHGVSLFMLFTAAWASVLARLSGQDDVLIGTLSANRGQREIESLIGFFVSTLTLRVDVSGEPDATELLMRVRQTALAAQENQDLPFEQVVEIAHLSRRLDHSPLFQVLFAWQSNDKSAFDLPGIEVRQADMSFDSIRYDLELHLYEKDDAVVGALGYSTALFDEASIARHGSYLIAMLRAMAASPGLALNRVPLLGPNEQALLDGWNDTSAAYPQDRCVHQLFEWQVARSPLAVALIHGEQQLSYAELNAQANQWARHLRASGVGIDQRVAICVERSFGMITALLAILKAGAAYVPLDPTYPSERLRQILDEAGVLLILSDAAGRDALGTQAIEQHQVVDLDTLAACCGVLPADDLGASPHDPSPDHLAYVIYTSGSTGTPKGVAMPHRPLVNLVHWQQQEAERAGLPAPRTLQFAALGFDVAFQEIFSSLCAGASLVLVDAQTRLQSDKLIELLRRQRVQRVFLPYIALQTLAEVVDEASSGEQGLLPELRDVIVAGEQLRLTAAIRQFFKRLPSCRLHNHYGPTETHVVTSLTLIGEAIAASPSHVPIGRPIANARTYLLDRHDLPVPLGAVGQLHIGGLSIARDYLGRAELTAERFLADPFNPSPGARMYRTGDLARYLADGRLVFLGRNDQQVKLRGFRIELGEIEARLAEHPAVRECVVIAHDGVRGEAQLVAYVVPLGHSDDLATALHVHLGSLLPAYMVPAAFVTLEAIPLTAHGKLDRKALPAPDEQALVHAIYEPPRGEIELGLAKLWQTLLGVTQVGRHDQFFELGGHSLIAVRLLSRIAQVFGVELPLATLFAQPVLHGLAQALADRLTEAGENVHAAIVPSPREQRLPLSYAQQRLWFLAQLDGASAAYHIPLALNLDGALDVAALRQALDSVFARHESVRTVFVAEHGQPHAELLAADSGLLLREHDLSQQPDVEAARARLLVEERNRPFDLAAGPLIRASLIRLDEHRHVLALTLHHIVADGWSLGILVRELGACYAAAGQSREDPLPPLPIQYADYVTWERKWLTAEHLAEQVAYWRSHLAGAPTLLELPTDRPRPARQIFAGAFLPLTLDRELTRDLKRLARQHGVTLFMLVLAAWAVVLSRLAGQQEVLIGTPTAGRGRQELESLIGFFINTLVLRIDLSAQPDIASLLAQVRQVALDAQAHQELPFEQVVDVAQVPRRMDQTPLVQVLFAWQSHDEGRLELPGIRVEPILEFDWVKFDLELVLSEVDGGVHGGINYASALFDPETIARHAGYLQHVLEAMATGDSRPISQMPMLSTAEQQLLLQSWNRTETPYPDQLCMHQLVERWAHESPQATALVCEERLLSYAELNAQANRLAHYLIELGVRPDQRVALCVEKGAAMFIALLGILKAGGAYVPLDPTHASARLDQILCDAAPHLLLCDDAGRVALGAAALASPDMLDLDDDSPWADGRADDPKVAGLGSHHLAYIIYTSGSTGTPKGVMVEHHGVINLAQSLSDRLGVTAYSRVSQFASLGFDASIFESAMTLASGAALYLPSGAERQSPAAFIAFIGRHRITHATLPPAFLQGHVEPPQWTHRPTLILAGEAPSPSLLKHWMRHAKLANAYGPTEITVCASVWVCPDVLGDLLAVPIGRPLANTRMYLLDEHGLPVPQGSIGELYIGGVGVTRGYLNRPELTTERFLPDPFDSRPGARMYRSGDLVRYLPDGNLVFLGRDDHQVKLRGFRIELGEIEAHLAMHPAVRENAVLAREDRPGEPRLVAYVVADYAGDVLVATLRDYLGTRLPEYMIPSAFVALQRLPLTANGKLDRKVLPAPDDQAFARRAYEPPHGKTEIALAALWRELLGVERIGRHDHFFELGGHSLIVAQLAARMGEIFEAAVAVRDLFLHPMLKDMARLALSTIDPARSSMLDLGTELVLDETIRAGASASHGTRPAHILLTGASGFLGAFLLSSLLKRTQATVHCLIRCHDVAEGMSKLDANMRLLGLRDYERGRVAVISGDLAQPRLGLSQRRFDDLAGLIEVIYHNGAWVNSLHTYQSLKAANVLGTQEILRLAGQGMPKHIHYISTLSTIPPIESAGPDVTTEAQLAEHWPGLASGYAQSKWVAERLLRIGGERGIPFTIYRPTHIAGSSRTGASNASDTWSLFVDACLILERIPEIDTSINSLPVDYMGDCIVELSLREGMHGKSLNLTSPQSFMLSELTRQITAVEGLAIERVDYRHWRRLCSEHPAVSRLASVMPAELSTQATGQTVSAPIELSNAVAELSREGMPYPPMTADLLRKYVAWRHRLSCLGATTA